MATNGGDGGEDIMCERVLICFSKIDLLRENEKVLNELFDIWIGFGYYYYYY